jgi:hypothetical protein
MHIYGLKKTYSNKKINKIKYNHNIEDHHKPTNIKKTNIINKCI